MDYGETREVNMSKTQCDWCWESATWKIIEPCSLDGYANACTVHGTEWYPHLFPESDVTPVETIIGTIQSRFTLDCLTCGKIEITEGPWSETVVRCKDCTKPPVSLVKSTDTNPLPYQSAMVAGHPNPLPWYPLHGHRPGLRANDMITLHSAFVILAMEGGTAHPSINVPEWETHPHQG